MMYLEYPEGYDQGLAEKNIHIYADVVPREFPVATLAAEHILVDTGLAQAMSCAYYCTRSELGRGRGSRDDVRDAYVSIGGLVRSWRRVFRHMDPGVVGNEDLAEIMCRIQLDGSEEDEFKEFENMEE